MIGEASGDVKQLPLVEAFWYAINHRTVYNEDVYKTLQERYRLEYEVKGEGRGWKADMGPV